MKKITNNIKDSDRALLGLVHSTHPTQSQLDAFLSGWDIEAEGSEKGLILAQFKQEHPDLVFPAYCGPRLDGLIRYHRFHCASLCASVQSRIETLRSQGVPVVALDDYAMKLVFPERPHSMWRVDIGVPAGSLKAARHFQDGSLMIRKMPDGYFSLGKPVTGPLMPDLDEMTYRCLLRLAYVTDETDSGYDIPKILNDIVWLTQKKPSTTHIRQMARKEKEGARLKAACDYLRTFLPGYEVEDYSLDCCSPKEWEKYLSKRKYIEEILRPARIKKNIYPLRRLKEEPSCALSWLRARIHYSVAKFWGKIK